MKPGFTHPPSVKRLTQTARLVLRPVPLVALAVLVALSVVLFIAQTRATAKTSALRPPTSDLSLSWLSQPRPYANNPNIFREILANRSARSVSAPLWAGELLAWNTNGNLGTETTELSTINDANVSTANLTLGSVTPAANGNRFGGSNWFDTGDTAAGSTLAESIAGNDYIQFVVTPNAGFSFTPTSLVFTWDRSATGPDDVTLRSSADSFSTDLGTVTGIVSAAFASNTITITGLTELTTATTFRLYGHGGTATGGTGGYDANVAGNNVTLYGTTAALPSFTIDDVSRPKVMRHGEHDLYGHQDGYDLSHLDSQLVHDRRHGDTGTLQLCGQRLREHFRPAHLQLRRDD